MAHWRHFGSIIAHPQILKPWRCAHELVIMLHGGPWISIENGGLQVSTACHQGFPASRQQLHAISSTSMHHCFSVGGPATVVYRTCVVNVVGRVLCGAFGSLGPGLQDLLLSSTRRQCRMKRSVPLKLHMGKEAPCPWHVPRRFAAVGSGASVAHHHGDIMATSA